MSTLRVGNITATGGTGTITVPTGNQISQVDQPSGLQLLFSNTYSNTQTINVNNVFSSTYENYRVVIGLCTTSTTVNNWLRLRSNGADNSTTNYRWGAYFVSTAGGLSGLGNGGDSVFVWSVGTTSDDNGGVIEFYRPAVSTSKTSFSSGPFFQNSATGYAGSSSGVFNSTGAFDGFTLSRDSGQYTSLTLRVYGYRN